MRTANTKLAVACLLATMVACQCLSAPRPAEPADSDDVEVTENKDGVRMCKGKVCQDIKKEDIDEKAKPFEDAFQPEAGLKEFLSSGSANATSCPAFNVRCHSRQCPRCTWDDGDECCPTCRYFSRVPTWLPGKCLAIRFAGHYQYTLNGICRNLNEKCGGKKKTCQQMYSWSKVVCLKPVWPRWYLTMQWYRHPSYCSCRNAFFVKPLRG